MLRRLLWPEWRKDYFTIRYVLRRIWTWWLWGLGVVIVLLWFL